MPADGPFAHLPRALSPPASSWGILVDAGGSGRRSARRRKRSEGSAAHHRATGPGAARALRRRLHTGISHFIQKLESQPGSGVQGVSIPLQPPALRRAATPSGFSRLGHRKRTGLPFVDGCMRAPDPHGLGSTSACRAMLMSVASYQLWLALAGRLMRAAASGPACSSTRTRPIHLEPSCQCSRACNGHQPIRLYTPNQPGPWINDPRGNFIRQWLPDWHAHNRLCTAA